MIRLATENDILSIMRITKEIVADMRSEERRVGKECSS